MIKAKPFATGQAQSQQSPYAGSTPYKKNPAGDFAAYSPQRTQGFGNTSQSTSPYGQSPQMPTSPTDGNWANYATPDRPTFQARYGQLDGTYADSPNYNQRDAFIQALNNQQTPYMTGQRSGPPQFDIGGAWNQASQMVQQGFQNPFAPNLAAQANPLPSLASQAFPSQYQGLTMAPQQGGFADIQRRLSNATTQEQLLEINRDGRAMMQPPARSASAGIRARGPGDPPERAAPRTRYQQEIDRMKSQGAYGPANPISEQERRMRTASPESMAQARREMEMSVARRRADDGQMPLRFQPGASQMVGGRIQSTGATGYGFGSGQGGPNPGAVGYYNRTGNQQPQTIGRKRGLGTSNRSPIYI